MVQVEVGPEERKFTLHKGLLCAFSSYFKAALEGGFKEAEEQVIRLPEDDVKVFERFQLWIYTGTFIEAGETEKDMDDDLIIGLYLSAEARGIPQLQNLAIDCYINNFDALGEVQTRVFRRIYENTLPSSPLRRLITDLTVISGGPSWFSEGLEKHWSREILLEVVRGLTKEKEKKSRRKPFASVIARRCDYHFNVEGEKPSNEKEPAE